MKKVPSAEDTNSVASKPLRDKEVKITKEDEKDVSGTDPDRNNATPTKEQLKALRDAKEGN